MIRATGRPGRGGVAMTPTDEPSGTARPGQGPSTDRRRSAGCPHCGGRRRAGERHCLRCRYDFAAGRLPAAPVLVPLRRPATRWEAHVDPDDDYALTRNADGARRPVGLPTVVVALDRQTVVIGRMTGHGQDDQRINLLELTGDPGVSMVHALLVRGADGAYRLLDQGSLNGTHLNSYATRIPRDMPTSLRDGDRIFVGAWSRLTIRRAAP